MSSKAAALLSIGAFVLAGAALAWGVWGNPAGGTNSEARIASLEEEVNAIKAGVPPMWGGWPANGWMVRVEDGPVIYFSGDTDINLNWEAIRDYYAPDIVIGTYAEIYETGVDEWVYITNILNPSYVLPSHHGALPFFPVSGQAFADAITSRTSSIGVNPPIQGEEFEVMGVKFTWLGHAGYMIETPKGSRVVFDPVWNAANTSGYPEALKDPNVLAPNIILVGHGHFDHFDPDALKQIMEPSTERTPYLLQLFEFSALTQKMMPEETNRGQLLPVNMGAWISKGNMQAAYNVGESYPDDVDIAAIFATHSSGVFSPIK